MKTKEYRTHARAFRDVNAVRSENTPDEMEVMTLEVMELDASGCRMVRCWMIEMSTS